MQKKWSGPDNNSGYNVSYDVSPGHKMKEQGVRKSDLWPGQKFTKAEEVNEDPEY